MNLVNIFIKIKDNSNQEECMLKYEDVSKLEGLGWIEYELPIHTLFIINFQLK
ncbi:hypothetical protein RhiirA4_479716 [Rhizophagus irregularis]|uniref:Uncharacterized protein n=1 Tax=Rhizophagus irregularis TaxID=588596 RepID=A0A2I1HGU1_9GLOM|nr:hypothetical protein RhiirA4_479716 [Rhizophagus irregularis]